MIDLRNMSADALDELSKRTASLAADLRKEQPSYDLALANGVQDWGYATVRYGWVPSFSGEAEIVMADGRRWRAIGHSPRGSAEHVSRNGWIEFVPCDAADEIEMRRDLDAFSDGRPYTYDHATGHVEWQDGVQASVWRDEDGTFRAVEVRSEKLVPAAPFPTGQDQ